MSYIKTFTLRQIKLQFSTCFSQILVSLLCYWFLMRRSLLTLSYYTFSRERRAKCIQRQSGWQDIQGHFRIQFHIQETLKRVTLPTFIIPSHAVQILMWSFELSLCCVYYCHFQHQDTWTNPGAGVTCELRGFCYISVQSTWARTGCNGKTVAINECKYKAVFFFHHMFRRLECDWHPYFLKLPIRLICVCVPNHRIGTSKNAP